MKLNKHKMGLVVVVMMILALPLIVSGCGAPAGNQTPDFLRVGGFYEIVGNGFDGFSVKVVEMRRDGWILVEARGIHMWINTTQLVGIWEEAR